jgi:hypothetical protein
LCWGNVLESMQLDEDKEVGDNIKLGLMNIGSVFRMWRELAHNFVSSRDLDLKLLNVWNRLPYCQHGRNLYGGFGNYV